MPADSSLLTALILPDSYLLLLEPLQKSMRIPEDEMHNKWLELELLKTAIYFIQRSSNSFLNEGLLNKRKPSAKNEGEKSSTHRTGYDGYLAFWVDYSSSTRHLLFTCQLPCLTIEAPVPRADSTSCYISTWNKLGWGMGPKTFAATAPAIVNSWETKSNSSNHAIWTAEAEKSHFPFYRLLLFLLLDKHVLVTSPVTRYFPSSFFSYSLIP